MAEQKPKLAVADCEGLNDWSIEMWRTRLERGGFETVDASYRVYNIVKRVERVAASAGLVVLNQNILDEHRGVYRYGSVVPLSDGLIKGVEAAHELKLPVYLTTDPSEASPSVYPNLNLEDFDPYTVIGDDPSIIWEQLQQEQPYS
jgi:hypothetical protein